MIYISSFRSALAFGLVAFASAASHSIFASNPELLFKGTIGIINGEPVCVNGEGHVFIQIRDPEGYEKCVRDIGQGR